MANVNLRALICAFSVSAGLFSSVALAVSDSSSARQRHPLLALSLEELFELEVTTASRKPEQLADVASAVYIISSEDIRRSTATAVPELLRMAPGVDVRRVDASHWAVSVRGFNGDFVSNLLVLLDGVSVYRPTFSGVNWDELDLDLAEIERIEVVRGPGAATWGVNAVNGVINIITRSSTMSQGNRVSVQYGDNLRPVVGLSHGGKVGERLNYKFSGYFRANGNSDGITDRGDSAADDSWYSRRLEFRADLALNSRDELTLIGRGWNSQRRQISDVFSPVAPLRSHPVGGAEIYGGTVMLALQQQRDWGSRHWQVHYDERSRHELRFNSRDKTLEFELTQLNRLSDHRERVWGLGYRHLSSELEGSFGLWADPDMFREDLFTGFLQESWTLANDRLRLTLGSKIEQSSRVDFNAQPSFKVSYRVDPLTSVWGSVSRAKRTPSRLETHGLFVTADLAEVPIPLFVALQGNSEVDAETLVAYEIGARHRFGNHLSIDMTLFLHDYDELIGVTLNNSPQLQALPAPHALLLIPFSNLEDARLYGVELSSNWKINKKWHIKASYSWSKLDGIGPPQDRIVHNPPEQIFNMNSYLSIGERWELDGNLRYTDKDVSSGVESWWSLDLRLGWHPRDDLKLSLVAKDLLESEHFEYNDSTVTEVSSVGRTAFIRLDWQF
ncbi:MAG: TonB-dependent receptor [Immundisolibacteraceae bacterium]|nr:TonB-dependent receptor [Immundisolibacteraceae bacterium]